MTPIGISTIWGSPIPLIYSEDISISGAIDFTDDIYDKEVSVEVISFIRDIIQVASEDELKQLIREDISKAKTLIDNK